MVRLLALDDVPEISSNGAATLGSPAADPRPVSVTDHDAEENDLARSAWITPRWVVEKVVFGGVIVGGFSWRVVCPLVLVG